MYNLDRNVSVREILKRGEVLNVQQTYDYNLAQIMFKAKRKELPEPLQNNFHIGIMRPCMFKVDPTRLLIAQKSIYQSAPRIWNSLPTVLSTEQNFEKFKVSVKKHILQK